MCLVFMSVQLFGQVAIITGTGNYYSAGVNLSGIIGMMSPATLHAEIVKRNAAVFDTFIDFPKPVRFQNKALNLFPKSLNRDLDHSGG